MMSWLWLACGAALLPFTLLQTTIAFAAWLAPIFLLRFSRTVPAWALPALAVAGGLVSVYHVMVERYPSLESGSCDPTNPCSIIWVERLGYMTIPTMALSGFALIAILLLLPEESP